MIHPTSDVQSKNIGENTNVWQFCVVLPDAKIGHDCNICSHCFIENDVMIGDRVTIKCGVQIWDGTTIGDDAFIGPNSTFTNDPVPRGGKFAPVFVPTPTQIGIGATVGANATLLPGVQIGRGALVGAGAVVTKNVPDYAIVVGSPARQVGWICHCGSRLNPSHGTLHCSCGRLYDLRNDLLVDRTNVTR